MNGGFLEKSDISTIVDLLKFRAKTTPNKTAYIFLKDGENEEIRLTYGKLDRQATAIASRLQKQFQAGDRALLLYPPGLEFISCFFGCLYAGVVAVPCYPPSSDKLQFSISKLQTTISACPDVFEVVHQVLMTNHYPLGIPGGTGSILKKG